MVSGTQQKYFMLGGKRRGVGKTSCAASLVVKFANHGHPSLVVSTDHAHSLSEFFDQFLLKKRHVVTPHADYSFLGITREYCVKTNEENYKGEENVKSFMLKVMFLDSSAIVRACFITDVQDCFYHSESCSVKKKLDATTATETVYQNKTNILFCVPKIYVAQAIKSSLLLLGLSVNKLKLVVEQLCNFDIRNQKLGKVITTTP
ncbi:hypothetical protein P3L10_028294 [Capsicum annuum]